MERLKQLNETSSLPIQAQLQCRLRVHQSNKFDELVLPLSTDHALPNHRSQKQLGALFGAQKMIFSRFALKKRPIWTAQISVLD